MTDPEDLDTRTLVLLLAGKLRDRVLTHPTLTLAGAATVGYMVGWSMPTPLYRTVASLAVRTLAMRVMGSALASLQGLEGDDDPLYEGDDLDLDLEEEGQGSTRRGRPGGPRSSNPPYVT